MVVYLGGPNDISNFGVSSPADVNLVSTFGWIGGGILDSIVIPDHVSRALSLLIEEFKRSPLLNDTLRIPIAECQNIENVGNDLLTARRLNQAGGAQLDGIGEIVGEPREGRADEEYRAAIKFKIFINTSNAEPETLIQALAFITGASDIKYWLTVPGSITMYTNGSFIPDNMVYFMESIAAAGVKIDHISSSVNTIPFVFANDNGSTPETGKGFSEDGYAPGGMELGGRVVEQYN